MRFFQRHRATQHGGRPYLRAERGLSAGSRARRVYDVLNMALWAFGAVFFGVIIVNLPRLSAAHSEAEIRRLLDRQNENRILCAKWGLVPDTQVYSACVLDLADLRRRDEQDVLDDAF